MVIFLEIGFPIFLVSLNVPSSILVCIASKKIVGMGVSKEAIFLKTWPEEVTLLLEKSAYDGLRWSYPIEIATRSEVVCQYTYISWWTCV